MGYRCWSLWCVEMSFVAGSFTGPLIVCESGSESEAYFLGASAPEDDLELELDFFFDAKGDVESLQSPGGERLALGA